MGKLYEIFGDNAHEMTVKLLEASQAADRIPKDGTVLLKPNLVLASPPEQGATRRPAYCRDVSSICKPTESGTFA